MELKVANQYEEFFDFDPPEPGGGEVLTDPGGYMPSQAYIEMFLRAGKMLEEYRQEQFDYYLETGEYDFDGMEFDPTRRPGYDMADAHQDMMLAEASLKASMKKKVVKDDGDDSGASKAPSGRDNSASDSAESDTE